MARVKALQRFLSGLQKARNTFRVDEDLGKQTALLAVIYYLRDIDSDQMLRVPFAAMGADLRDKRVGGNLKSSLETALLTSAARAIDLVKEADGDSLESAAKRVAVAMGRKGQHDKLLTFRSNLRKKKREPWRP